MNVRKRVNWTIVIQARIAPYYLKSFKVHLRWKVDLRSHWAVCSHGSIAGQPWETSKPSKTNIKIAQRLRDTFEQKYAPLNNVGCSEAFCRGQNISQTLQASKLINFISEILYTDFDLERVSTLTWCLWELGVIYIFHYLKSASWQSLP